MDKPKKSRYLLPSWLFLSGYAIGALFDGTPIGYIGNLLAGMGILGWIYVWRTPDIP